MIDLTDPQYKTEDGSALRIWRDAAPNKFQTERHNRPLFDDVIYVEVISPGSRDSSPVFEVLRTYCSEAEQANPGYGVKYKEYEKFIVDFIKGEEVDKSLTGTPLQVWPAMTRPLVMSFRAQEIYTVDALAALPDSKLAVLGPEGRMWRDKAKQYLDAAKGGEHAAALAADLEVAKADKEDLQRQIAELAETVKELQAKNTSEVEAQLRAELDAARAEIAKFDGKGGGKAPKPPVVDTLAPAPSIG